MALPDIASLDTYGGALSNYISAPVDPTTDRDAGAANEAYSDTAGMTATAVRAWARFTLNGAGSPVLVSHNANWGGAPAVAPSASHVSTGRLRVTWPATVTDSLGVVHTLSLRDGFANVRGPYIQYVGDGAGINSRDLYVFDAAGAATNGSGEAFTVYVI